MIWQDIIIAIANILFSYSLVFQVYIGFKEKKGKMAFQSSLLTTMGLYALSFSFYTLNLILSGIVANFNATMWLLLFIQTIVYNK